MIENFLFVLLLANAALGLPSKAHQSRIVGGSPATVGQFPHQVSLRFFGQGEHICGGSVISNEWVLTAAHCVDGTTPADLKVVTGSLLVTSGGTSYAVTEMYQHENYIVDIIKNDIALLRVEPMVYTDNVRPVVLEDEYVGGQESVVISGWGMQGFPGPVTNDLQFVNLRTTTTADCAVALTNIDDTQVCTLTKAGEGLCRYDSGGPLVRTVDGVTKQVGIVSWGILCALGYPDVYTRVSAYSQWINNTCGCI